MERIRLKLGFRSGQWSRIRKLYLEDNNYCAACNAVSRLTVHHIIPFSVDRSLELDLNNLITMCSRCHLTIGHHNDYRLYNENCRVIASMMFAQRSTQLMRL